MLIQQKNITICSVQVLHDYLYDDEKLNCHNNTPLLSDIKVSDHYECILLPSKQ